ncbi:MAG: phosphoserine phosphatase, partial [Actinomycetia bacterium]|nr:phosphoserine phosphatase [Actinomycetes bacterium]
MSTKTILIRISGPDHPGITAALMALLAAEGCQIQDVEQVVIRNRLILSLVVEVDSSNDLRADLLLFGYEQKVEIDFEEVSAGSTESDPGLVVTILGKSVNPIEFGAVASVVATNDGNIDRII